MGLEHLELKKEVIAICIRLKEMGYIVGTYGNVSVRVPEGLIITPSRIEYYSLTPEDMVTVSYDGRVIDGRRLPSSEFAVHRGIYPLRPEIHAVIHTHSFYATTLSCLREPIPVIVEEQSQVLGSEIACTNYVPAGQHHKLGEEVAKALGSNNAVLMANHGTVSCGCTLSEAFFTCQIVERVARMRVLTSSIGGAVTIPREFVESERERWLYKYGKAEDKATDP